MKCSLRKILCFFLVVLVLPLFSLTARAEDYSAKLHSLHFDIMLFEDGSAYITETREVVFTGDHEFTRYGVKNKFTGPRMFTDWQVLIDGTPVLQLDEPDNDNRPENTFAVEDVDGGNTVHIYFRQQGSGACTFEISYWVENAVKLHSDVGEFFWNLTGETGISDIGTVTATLTVPESIPTEEFRIWAHGPLNGTFEKQPGGSAFLQVDNVPLGTIVDIRSTMPADCFYAGWEQEGEALDDILAEEKELADSANAKREEEERRRAEQEAYWAERAEWGTEHPILNSIERFGKSVTGSVQDFVSEKGLFWLCFIIFAPPFLAMFGVLNLLARILHRIYMKMFRKHPNQSPRYYRDLPDDWPAPVVDRLVHFYDGKPELSRQISATLLELNLKKLVNFRTVDGDSTILLNKQLGEEQEHIPDYQKILWEFLRNAVDESGQISIKDLNNYIKDNHVTALDFRKKFESAVESEFMSRVKSKDLKNKSLGKRKHRLIISAAAGILAVLICSFGMLYDGFSFGPSLLAGLIVFVATFVILSIIGLWIWFVILESSCRVLEQQSEDDLALWQAFGRFLDDFTTFEDKELPEFSVWREYMVYAVAMGNGQKVAKALALKYPEAYSAGTNTGNDDIYYMLQDTELYDAMDSVGREVAEVRAPASSGGGGDGGFSDSGGGSDSGAGGDFID